MKTRHIGQRIIGLTRAAAIVIVFAVIGMFALRSSSAATYATTAEAESGTNSGNATTVSDGLASGGSAVKFGSAVVQPSPKPSTSNTGILPGSTLTTHNGNYTITTDGTNISNMRITGSLYVAANNVTVTNVKIDGNLAINRTPGGVIPAPPKKNMTFTNIDVRKFDSEGLDTVKIDKSRIQGNDNDFHAQIKNYYDGGGQRPCIGFTLTNSYFDKRGPITDPDLHRESLHLMGCTNVVIRNNVFDMTPDNFFTLEHTTAAVFFQTWEVYNENVTFDGNWLYGGGYYQIYLHAKNMTVTNNKFHSYPGGEIVYPPRNNSETYYPFTQSGNTLDGQPYTLLNSK